MGSGHIRESPGALRPNGHNVKEKTKTPGLNKIKNNLAKKLLKDAAS
ncbi:MAG: hypothetical protein PHW96_01690 [Candidatus Nanoarchaeia archaeon]|nr:hypothetical protein [Candidatus Nanoarchaeia archaeon]